MIIILSQNHIDNEHIKEEINGKQKKKKEREREKGGGGRTKKSKSERNEAAVQHLSRLLFVSARLLQRHRQLR
jgi:DNA invertase Pin-like site-specific DNA recombinase